MVNNDSSPGKRRRMIGIPAVLMETTAAKAATKTGQASKQMPEGHPNQSLRQQNGQKMEEPKALAQSVTQPRPVRRRMGGPSVVVPLDIDIAPPPVESDATDLHGAETPAGLLPTVEAASISPAARRMGPPSAAASGTPAEPRRIGTAEPVGAPTSLRETQAQAMVRRTPAAATRSDSPTEQGSPAYSTKKPVLKGRIASALRSTTVRNVIIVAGVALVFLAIVLLARWLRTLSGVETFIADYNAHSSQPASAPVGIPSWLGWQHFLNMFFMVLIVRTGLQVRRERRPPGYWTAKKGSFFSPGRQTPKKISLSQWVHQSLDVLWVVNGLVFIILLFASGHWMRIVPTSWDVFPHMLSAGLQYASLDWPTENGWVHYNALQVMAYFLTVMIAAPLAVLSGIRLSTWWPSDNEKLTRLYPVEAARALHFPVMIYFVAFTIVHVFLVIFTGALRNLNHMYTSRDVADFWGLVVFLISLVIVTVGWILTGQMFVLPAAGKMGKVTKN